MNADPSSPPVDLQRSGDIATVVLNRPEKLNALTKGLWLGLGDIFAALSEDSTLRCIVLRGAGSRAFSPGNDIGEFATERANLDQGRAYGAIMAHTLDTMARCPHPVVVLIQGICVGGGLELAATGDLRICGTSSRFGVPINRLGLTMAYPEIRALVGLVGRAVALEMLLEGQIFSAQEALAKGLVTRVVADAAVEAEAYACARRIAQGAPLVARWHKRFIRRLEDPAPLAVDEADEGYACFATEDFQIGYRAFLAKETPVFKGR